MTTVEILFRYSTPPTQQTALALAEAKDVYGIRSLSFHHADRTLCVEYDATRLNSAAIAKLIRQAGLEVVPAPASEMEQPPRPSAQPASAV